jgi:hypothetical protein
VRVYAECHLDPTSDIGYLAHPFPNDWFNELERLAMFQAGKPPRSFNEKLETFAIGGNMMFFEPF